MTRAERRRQEKAEKRKKATYNLTKEQLDAMIKEGVEKEVTDAYNEGFSEGMNQALILMFSIPLVVLRDHYWKKTFRRKMPGFMDKVFEIYDAWQDGEFDINELRDDLWEHGGIRLEEKEE